MSAFVSAFVAAFVGFAASIAVILAAAQAVGASPAQTISWIAALAIAKGASSIALSWRYRQPIIAAWSTPGAALVATSVGVAFSDAVGAFLVAALLMILTALIKPLGQFVARIPLTVASAMLAGIVFRFVTAAFDAGNAAPALIGVMFAVFLLVRLVQPMLSVVAALAVGILSVVATGAVRPSEVMLTATTLAFVEPTFTWAAAIGLGLPLYLVTMASQNLPGFAVLRAAGYAPPTAAAIGVTGLASLAAAPFGAHMVNMAAISAAICTGPDAHKDPAQRWKAGVWYGLWWLLIAVLSGSILSVFSILPQPLIIGIGGLGLIGSLLGALSGTLSSTLSAENERFAAVITFAISASSLALFGVGSAFWGLTAGLIVLAIGRVSGERGAGAR